MVYDKHQSWYRQKELRTKYRDTEVPSISEIDTILTNINYGKVDPITHTLRARALIAIYYLTAGRLTEVTKRKYAYKSDNIKDDKGRIIERRIPIRIEPEFKGITKQDISYDTIDELPVMYLRLENRKHRLRKTKRQPIPISLEQPIIKHIEAYTNTLKVSSLPLFRFTNKRATQIINDTTGFNCHFWRHIRATHLITLYDFNEQALIEYMGWTDARPAKHYMELSKKDLFRSFYKNKK